MIPESNSAGLSSSNTSPANVPHSFGIEFHYLKKPILPQAVGGILTQALYEIYSKSGLFPLQQRQNFFHQYAETSRSRVCFDVGVSIDATMNGTGLYALTNQRVAQVISLMGFDFSHQEDLNQLTEYKFDVVVKVGDTPQTIIGQGKMMNTDQTSIPLRNAAGIIVSSCQDDRLNVD